MTDIELIEILKLHDNRKRYLNKNFNITLKKIQTDIDLFIAYLKSLNKTEITKNEFLYFAANNPNTFFHILFNWENTANYRLKQLDIIMNNCVLVSSNNELIMINLN